MYQETEMPETLKFFLTYVEAWSPYVYAQYNGYTIGIGRKWDGTFHYAVVKEGERLASGFFDMDMVIPTPSRVLLWVLRNAPSELGLGRLRTEQFVGHSYE